MNRFLALLVVGAFLFGCKSAPVTLVITDYDDGTPIEGAKVSASHHVLLDPFAPSREDGVTDSDGRVTIRLKQYKSRGPYLSIHSGAHSEYDYASLSISGKYVSRAADHYRSHRSPLQLHVKLPKRDRSESEKIRIVLPENYVGPIGIVCRGTRDINWRFNGILEIRIVTDGEVIAHADHSIESKHIIKYEFRRENGEIIDPYRLHRTGDYESRLVQIYGRPGINRFEIEPGVVQRGRAISDADYVYFIGTLEDIDEYRSTHRGHQRPLSESEIHRMLGDPTDPSI